jgi:hypothetical protein
MLPHLKARDRITGPSNEVLVPGLGFTDPFRLLTLFTGVPL